MWQEQILLNYFDASLSSANARILEMMMRAIRESGVPTLVYTDPMNPEAMGNAEVQARIETMNAALGRLAESASGARISFWLSNPDHGLRPEDYNDNMHLKNPEKLIEQLTGRVNAIIAPNEGEENKP